MRIPAGFLIVCSLLAGAGCVPRVAGSGDQAVVPALASDHIVAADGVRLPLRVWRPDGQPSAVLLALHGFNDYSKSFEEPAEFWLEYGIATYAYDQRGFGEAPHRGIWAGSDAMVEDLATVAGLLRERYPGTPLYAIGESMGGAVILTALASGSPPPVDGVILSAPAVRGWRAIPWWQRAGLWTIAHLMPWAKATGRGFDIRPSDNIEMLRALGRDPLVIKETRFDSVYGLVTLMDRALASAPHLDVPALVLYGEHEELVPRRGRELLIKSLPEEGNWRLAVYPRGFHMLLRDLHADEVRGDIAAWIAAPDGPLPSGAERQDRTLPPPAPAENRE